MIKSLQIQLRIAILLFLPVAASAGICTRIWTEQPPELANINATTPLATYGQNNFRDYEQLTRRFGQIYDRKVNALKPGDLVIQGGSGFGFAGMQISAKTGAEAILINVQDVSHFIDDVVGVFEGFELGSTDGWGIESKTYADRFPLLKLESVKGMSANVIYALIKSATGVSFETSNELPYTHRLHTSDVELVQAEIRQWIGEVQKSLKNFVPAIKDFKKKLKITYEIGYAENVLPEYKGRADLIDDFLGAHYYSSCRAELIETYFRTLKPGGMAFIIMPNRMETKPDMITVRGKEMTMAEFLVKSFPKVFKTINSYTNRTGDDDDLLIMTKPANMADLKLGLVLDGPVASFSFGNGYVVPSLHYKLLPDSDSPLAKPPMSRRLLRRLRSTFGLDRI